MSVEALFNRFLLQLYNTNTNRARCYIGTTVHFISMMHGLTH